MVPAWNDDLDDNADELVFGENDEVVGDELFSGDDDDDGDEEDDEDDLVLDDQDDLDANGSE
jgi:hypothetical protein